MPNPRSSEIGNPMRRSFTGNPFSKPSSIVPNHAAKSPSSDFSRRESVGSLRDSFDDKENGKDQILKPAKVRSPAVLSKGSKSFMSPTISASRKISESPRKKVLAERNDGDPKSHVRKVAFSQPLEDKRIDGVIPNFEEGSRSSLSGESETSEIHYMNVPSISKNDIDLSFESVNVPLVPENDIHTEPSFETEPDCVNLDPTFKLSPTATTPVSLKASGVAPLDADPLMPPYDPKTNYLSPRPQFLHYKPRPRMELCRERELGGIFISGSFSDAEVTEDAQSEVSQKELEDAQSEVSQKDLEDVSSDETVKEEASEIFEHSPAGRTLTPEESVEAKEVRKPRLTVRAKAVALMLLLAVAFVSISVKDSPMIDRAVFEDFYRVCESSEFSEFAWASFDRLTQFTKTNLDEIARNLQIWFTKLLSSISEFISDVRGTHNLGKLQYYNLSVQHDYSVVDQYPIFGRGENEIGESHVPVWDSEEADAASDIGSEEEIEEDISEEHYQVYEEQVQQDIGTITGVENVLDAPESEEVVNMIESEQLAEAGNLEAMLAIEAEANLNFHNQPSLNSEAAEIGVDAYESDAKQAQENDAKLNVNKQSGDSLDSDVAAVNDDVAEEKSVSIDTAIKGSEERLEAIDIPPHMVLYSLLCVGIVLIAGAAFNWSKKGKSKSNGSMESFPSMNKQISPEKSFGPTEMDVLEDSSYPSEASSFQQSSLYSEKVVNEGHKLGQEKKRKNNYRRESLASSSSDYSTGSPSYGSLTVYEKIPIKQGHGDDEIITPVRRSSRIRNQATSPS